MKVIIVPIMIGTFGTVTKGLLKGLDNLKVGGRIETIQTSALLRTAPFIRPGATSKQRALQINSENGQNTEKSPVDLRRLAVTQATVKDHQLRLVWKTLNEEVLIKMITLILHTH